MTRREILLAQLRAHGLNHIEKLSDSQLEGEFKKATIEWSKNFISHNFKSVQSTIEVADSAIVAKIKGASDFYALFNELLVEYPYGAIYECIANALEVEAVQKALLILEIKYRQYQEIIIDEIRKKTHFMPDEEVADFMLFIEKNRDEVELLKNILAQLNDAKIAQTIRNISNLKKYILSEFMPDDLEQNYKQFFNHSKDKQDLIASLQKISSAYSKKQLDDMTKGDLVEILNAIKQREIDDKKDKEDFKRYFAEFKNALYSDDTSVFDALVIQVLEDVSKDCLAKLKAHLSAEDTLFESKFTMAQREWNRLKAHG
ncbi:hypothetical protein [Helicobacter sp. 23-1045]